MSDVRREVLGDEHVDRALASASPFTAPWQDHSAHAWGAVWARPGLDRRTRSLLTLALLTAQRAETELAMHVEAAIRNGVTAEEIGEMLLQRRSTPACRRPTGRSRSPSGCCATGRADGGPGRGRRLVERDAGLRAVPGARAGGDPRVRPVTGRS